VTYANGARHQTPFVNGKKEGYDITLLQAKLHGEGQKGESKEKLLYET
jgi:hypothetical protein